MAGFTVDELKQIFEAGVAQGRDEAWSRDWGTVSRYTTERAFFEAVRDVLIDRKGGWVEGDIVKALIGTQR